MALVDWELLNFQIIIDVSLYGRNSKIKYYIKLLLINISVHNKCMIKKTYMVQTNFYIFWNV